jgi:hypothetical protein
VKLLLRLPKRLITVVGDCHTNSRAVLRIPGLPPTRIKEHSLSCDRSAKKPVGDYTSRLGGLAWFSSLDHSPGWKIFRPVVCNHRSPVTHANSATRRKAHVQRKGGADRTWMKTACVFCVYLLLPPSYHTRDRLLVRLSQLLFLA